MLTDRYSAWVNHQSLKQSLGTIMEFDTTLRLSGTLFWRLGGFNDSNSILFCSSWAQCQQTLPSTLLLGITDVATGARYHSIDVYNIINIRVICHSSGMCSSFCLTDLYFSVNCPVSSTVSVLVHGQIANSREKALSSISKHFISWLKISHRREVSSLLC